MKKKTVITIITALIALALLLPVALGTGATEIFGLLSGSSFSSFITFYNARNEETALYVHKKVTTAVPSAEVPIDDEFQFTIEMDGELAVNQSYLLFNKDGKQIYLYATGPSLVKQEDALELEWKTDDYGCFTLKDGETAKFDSLSPGIIYKVVESDHLHYIPDTTEDGISGTLPPGGARIEFQNMYLEGEAGTLEVRRNISYPEGFELPGDIPKFSFEIKVAGKKYANKECEIKDIKTGETLDLGQTDANGILKLDADTYAVFRDIPSDVDYSVKEIMDESVTSAGWRISGQSSQSGATVPGAGAIASFTNVQAAFMVTKTMFAGNASDDYFDFQVIDGQGHAFGKSLYYYLYDRNRALIKTDEHPDGIYKTAVDGTFTMKASQSAVFFAVEETDDNGETSVTGIEKGTKYGVREVSSGRYIQILPVQAAGYEGKIVGDSVEELVFMNANSPSGTLLTVKKILDNQAAEGEKVPDIKFTFKISKLNDQGAYEPVTNMEYSIGTGTGAGTYVTDEKGYFYLRAWEEARFTGLSKGDTYQVEEIVTDVLPSGFDPADPDPKTGVLDEATLEMQFKNIYDGDYPVLSVLKVNKAGQGLAGAKLQLLAEDKKTLIHEWTSKATAEEIPAIPGTYYIREIEAPEGYIVSEDEQVMVVEDLSQVQKVSFVNERSTDVPTGLEALRSPLVRTIIILVIVLAALAAVYFGIFRKRNKT